MNEATRGGVFGEHGFHPKATDLVHQRGYTAGVGLGLGAEASQRMDGETVVACEVTEGVVSGEELAALRRKPANLRPGPSLEREEALLKRLRATGEGVGLRRPQAGELGPDQIGHEERVAQPVPPVRVGFAAAGKLGMRVIRGGRLRPEGQHQMQVFADAKHTVGPMVVGDELVDITFQM